MTDVIKLLETAIEQAENFFKNKQIKEAEALVDQMLKVDNTNVKAMQLSAFIKYINKNYDKAIELFSKVLEIDYRDAKNHSNISLCYSALNKMKSAIYHAHLAVELEPKKHIYYNNIALTYKNINLPEIAVKYLKKALKINPNDSTLWSNLGSIYSFMKDVKSSVKCMEKSVDLLPDNPELQVNLANAYFLTGDYEKAWEKYEYRSKFFAPSKYLNKAYDQNKLWDGKKDITGKKLVVFSEQGAGDGIQFSRFLPFLKDCELKIHTLDKGLKELFSYNFGESVLEPVKEYDYYCSMMSLPYILKIKDLPNKPYIKTNKKIDLSIYKEYKIGIVWAGNPQHANDVLRSCKLSYFRNLYNIKNVKLFCLQKDLRKRSYVNAQPVDLAENCDDMKLVDMREHMETFLDTAGIIKELDLVISVDTSVLHLSGALGKKTWGLIPYNPDWRWGIKGENTIWYPSIKLFRQPKPSDWNSVFKQVEEELIKVIS